MNVNELVIDVKNLSKNISGKPIVKNVTLQIKPGEIFGFLGPNGSGKTTTMRMLCGLLRPSGGEGHCMGYDISQESEFIKRHTGYVQQYFGLYKNLTVYQNLKLIAELHNLGKYELHIKNVIDELNLDAYENQLAGTLSGGLKQKLSLAAAMIHNPILLLLDEPTASIDVQSRRIFWELIHDLSERGVTIIFTSHNMSEIEHSHRIGYFYQGNLLITGSVDDILKDVKLITWLVKGENIFLLAKQLRMLPSVEQVITFSKELRVIGVNPVLLNQDLKPYLDNPNYQWTSIQPNIEDVFVFFSKKYEAR